MKQYSIKKSELKKIIRESIIKEFDGDDGNIGYGQTSSSVLSIFAKPFGDVVNSATALASKSANVAKVLSYTGYSSLWNIIPGIEADYDSLISRINDFDKQIEEKYSDTFKRVNAVFNTAEFKFVALMTNPSLFVSKKALDIVRSKSDDVKEQFIDTLKVLAKPPAMSLLAIASIIGLKKVWDKTERDKDLQNKNQLEARKKIAERLQNRLKNVSKETQVIIRGVKDTIEKSIQPVIAAYEAKSIEDIEKSFNVKLEVDRGKTTKILNLKLPPKKNAEEIALRAFFVEVKNTFTEFLEDLRGEYGSIPEINEVIKSALNKVAELKR